MRLNIWILDAPVPVLSTLHSRPIDRLAVEHDDDRNYQAMRRAAIFTALPKSERSPEVVRVVRFGNLDRLPGRVGCVLDLWQYVLIIRVYQEADYRTWRDQFPD